MASTKTQKPARFAVGESHVHCQGKVVTGPDRLYFWLAFAMTFVPSVVFIAAVIPNLVNLIPYAWILYIPEALLAGIVFSSFFITSFMDPGVIPRQRPPVISGGTPWSDVSRRPPTFRDVMIGDFKYQQKYCDTCNFYRPPRAVHCGVCNNCVDRFDHHCPWVGNCVGRRNYRFFLTFIYGVMVKLGFCFSVCAYEIYHRYWYVAVAGGAPIGTEAFKEVLKNPASFILLFYCFAIVVFVGILAVFHCRLVSGNLTTNEHIKGTLRTQNPFDRGCIANWIFMCCPPAYEDYLKIDEKWAHRHDIEAPPPKPVGIWSPTTPVMTTSGGANGSAGYSRWRTESHGSTSAPKRTAAKKAGTTATRRKPAGKKASTATKKKKKKKQDTAEDEVELDKVKQKKKTRKATKPAVESSSSSVDDEPVVAKKTKKTIKPKKKNEDHEEEESQSEKQSESLSSSRDGSSGEMTPKAKKHTMTRTKSLSSSSSSPEASEHSHAEPSDQSS